MFQTLKKFFYLMNRKMKIKSLIIIFLQFIAGILELFSLAMIIPIIQVIIDPTSLEYYYSFIPFNQTIKSLSYANLINIIIGSTVAIYIIKNLYLLLIQWYQQNFLRQFSIHICDKLFSVYLKKNLLFFNDRNSGTFIKTLEKDSEGLNSHLSYAFSVILEIFIIISICILLFFVQPIGMILTILFYLIGAYLFVFVFKKKTKIWSIERFNIENAKLKYLKSIVESIRDIKLLNLENYYLYNYNNQNKNYFRVMMKHLVIINTPRLWIEIITVSLIFTLVAVLVKYENIISSDLLPILGLYVGSAFKLIPSFNKIISSIQGLRFIKPAINQYYYDILESTNYDNIPSGKKKIEFNNKIIFKNITFSYEENIILKNVSLEFNKGEKIGIYGDSGAGKSTFLDILSGLISPQIGEVLVDGQNINLNLQSWQKKISYLSQSTILIDDTIKNNILMGDKDNYDSRLYDNCIKDVKLDTFINNLKDKDSTIIGERGAKISGGQKQRIGLARIICLNRDVLILDESTNAIDEENEEEILKKIWKLYKHKTIIIVSHNKKNLSNCDSVYKFENYKLIKFN